VLLLVLIPNLAVLQAGTEIKTVPEREGGLADAGEINHGAVKKTAGQETERLAVEIAPPRICPRMRVFSQAVVGVPSVQLISEP
jgi:hypothetical protein